MIPTRATPSPWRGPPPAAPFSAPAACHHLLDGFRLPRRADPHLHRDGLPGRLPSPSPSPSTSSPAPPPATRPSTSPSTSGPPSPRSPPLSTASTPASPPPSPLSPPMPMAMRSPTSGPPPARAPGRTRPPAPPPSSPPPFRPARATTASSPSPFRRPRRADHRLARPLHRLFLHASFFPPSFTNYYQSSASASPGQTVTFDVTALDSQASSLSFAWTPTPARSPRLRTPPAPATSSGRLPPALRSGVTPSITATVTNAYGLSASKPFSVTGVPVCAAASASAGTMAAAGHERSATLLNRRQGPRRRRIHWERLCRDGQAVRPGLRLLERGRLHALHSLLPLGDAAARWRGPPSGGYNSGGSPHRSEVYDPPRAPGA